MLLIWLLCECIFFSEKTNSVMNFQFVSYYDYTSSNSVIIIYDQQPQVGNFPCLTLFLFARFKTSSRINKRNVSIKIIQKSKIKDSLIDSIIRFIPIILFYNLKKSINRRSWNTHKEHLLKRETDGRTDGERRS